MRCDTFLTTSQPFGLFFDPSNNLIFSSTGNNDVVKFLESSSYSTSSPVPILPYALGAEGIGMDASGNLFLTAYGGDTVTELCTSGTCVAPSVNAGSSATITTVLSVAANTTIGSIQPVNQGISGASNGSVFNTLTPDSNPSLCTAKTYSIATVCDVDVAFKPTYPGPQYGAVNVLDGSSNVLDTAYISGTGTASLAGFAPGTISTIAGGGTAIFTASSACPGTSADTATDAVGDGCPAINATTADSAELSNPNGVAVDGAGNLYIADQNNNLIRKVTAATGIITTVAGNGTGGYSGDAGAATSAELHYPNGVAVDGAGDLYIADTNNSLIRKVTAAASPITFATATNVGSTDTTDGVGGVFTVTLTNNGNTALSFPQPLTSGATNPSVSAGYELGSGAGACPQVTSSSGSPGTLASGASCALSISFSPIAPANGAVTGSVVVTDNSLNASSTTQTIPLTGTAVAPAVNHFAFTGLPSTATAGASFTGTVTAYSSTDNSTVATGYTGPVKFTSTDASAVLAGSTTLTAGVSGTLTFTLKTAGTQTITVADSSGSPSLTSGSIVVSAGAAATITAATGSGQSAGINTAFTNPLVAQVTDAYTNPIGGAMVTFTAPATGASAALSAATCTTSLTNTPSGSCSVTATANGTGGAYSVTAATGGLTAASFSLTNTAPHAYLVAVTTDTTTGVASNCVDQNSGATVSNANCSLRDALAAASVVESSTFPAVISFSSGVFTTSTTITEANGTMTIPGHTTIQGLTSGSGGTLTNLITVSGNNANTVFTTVPAAKSVVISSLNIIDGNNPANGGGLALSGAAAVTIDSSTFSGNSAPNSGYGGAILVPANPSSALTINDSTFSGNSAGGLGGAIEFKGKTLAITNSTFTGNTAAYASAIDLSGSNSSSLTATITATTIAGNTGNGAVWPGSFASSGFNLANSIIAGNTAPAGAYPDIYPQAQPVTDNGGNLYTAGTTTSGASSINPYLASLGSYGGPTQTMLPLPSSPAFCAGTVANAAGLTTDQRGNPRIATYNGNQCVAAGAAEPAYSIAFAQQPTSTQVNASITPSPTVQLSDNGAPIALPGASVNMYATNGGLFGTRLVSTDATGLATFPGLSISSTETADTLQATVQVPSGPGGSNLILSATSNTFNVAAAVNHFAFAGLPSTATAGASFTGTVTAYSSPDNSTVATGYAGPVTFTSTDASAVLPGSTTLTAGVSGTLTFTLKTAGAQTITVADSSGSPSLTSGSILVSAAAAASISASSGTPQSAVIGAAFANPLKVLVADAYSNPIGGVIVAFTPPTTGASAVLSAATCTTSTTAPIGICSVAATANGTASATAYTVGAKAAGITAGASFTLTNTQYTATMTVVQTPATSVYGQQATVVASISPLSIAGSAPTGAVTIYDGAASVGAGSAISGAGLSSFTTTTAPSVGTHNYAASYAGDTNFTAVAKTGAPGSVIVGKASLTLTGPTSTIFIPYGQSGTFSVSLAGQYSGVGITPPSGNVSASVGDGLNTSLAGPTVNGVATFTFPSNGAVHTYNVTVSYGGDSNYAAATTITVPVQVGQITPMIALAQPSAITYGAALGGLLNATAANSGSAVAGTFTYTATPAGGSASTATAASVLGAGAFTITATFSPTDTTTYTTNSANVTLMVNQAAPTVAWAKPGNISYGTALGATQLNATATGVGGAALPGTFTYMPPAGTVLSAMGPGVIQSLGVIFTPTDTVDYTTATDAVGITVNPATPTITWATPAAITYGTALSSAQLNATASVAGTLVYTPTLGTVLGAGAQTLKASFTPTDAVDYTAATPTVTLQVNQEPLSVVVANATQLYGAALPTLTGTVTGVVNGDAITASYSTTATVASAVGAYPVTAALSGTALANYAVTNTPGTLTIAQAMLTATANNATKVYGAANPAFTGSVSGQQSGDSFTETFSTTATTASVVGTYAIVPSVTGANLADYMVAAGNGTLSVTKASPSIALASSAASVLDQNPVTFTATVGSSVSTPTGTVAFLDGTTMLGSGTLAGGAASFTTSSLAVGAHTITAVYSGDANFAGATTAALAQTIQDFNLNISTSAGSTTSVTVVPGGTATYTLIISPTGSSTFPSNVALSVSGLPTGATYTLTPSSIAAGAGTTNVTLTIQVPKTTAMLQRGNRFGRGFAPIALGLLLPPFSLRMRGSAKKLGRATSLLLLLLLGAGAVAGLTGCGTNTGYFGQPQQSYTVSVTGTSGVLVHSTTVTLTVQ